MIQVAFKNWVPFTKCISIDGTTVDNAEEILCHANV